jgi:hypothetical protein
MPTYTETNRLGDVVKREFDPLLNRETVTLISGQNLKCGAVLGQITTGGKFTLHAAGASDGSQNAKAVLLFDTDASGGDTKAVVLARGPAVVSNQALIFAGGISAPNRATAIAALAALGIVARDGI